MSALIKTIYQSSHRKGLFHPDDIKTLGLNGMNGPSTAPSKIRSASATEPPAPTVRTIARTSSAGSRPPYSPLQSPSILSPSTNSNHQRSMSHTGSVGRAAMQRQKSSSELDRYTESDEEDYDDVFAKANETSLSKSNVCYSPLMNTLSSHLATGSDSPTDNSSFQQVVGRLPTEPILVWDLPPK